MNFDEMSVIALYSAMAVYAIAFIAYAIDLAKRSSMTAEVAESTVGSAAASARAARTATAAGGYGSTATIAPAAPVTDAAPKYGRSAALRVGVALTVIGWLLHLSADILRGLAAGRVPWANMYEFAMTGTLVIVAVFLIANLFVDLRFLGTFVTGLVLILLGLASVNFYVSVSPLPPALQSIWLVIHVFVAATAVGLFALGFGLSVVQLLQFRRESLAAGAKSTGLRLLATLPSSTKLEALAYRINIIGFILWTFTLMAGAIGPRRPGAATGAGTPRKSGPSSSGSSSPATSTLARPADGAALGLRGSRSSASRRCCSTSPS